MYFERGNVQVILMQRLNKIKQVALAMTGEGASQILLSLVQQLVSLNVATAAGDFNSAQPRCRAVALAPNYK